MKKKQEQSFEEYRKEQEDVISALNQEMEDARKKQEQIQHQIQRKLNEAQALKKKRNKQRTVRLIRKGASIEAVCEPAKYLTETEFHHLAEGIFSDKNLQMKIEGMVAGRAEVSETEKEELNERISMYEDFLKEKM